MTVTFLKPCDCMGVPIRQQYLGQFPVDLVADDTNIADDTSIADGTSIADDTNILARAGRRIFLTAKLGFNNS